MAERTNKIVIVLAVRGTRPHHLPLAELQARAAWIFDKYVDEAGVRQRVEPMDADATVALEIRPDKLRTWHP